MQKITYVVQIEDGIVLDDIVLKALDDFVEEMTECKVYRSRIEDDDTVVENGEWEVGEDE